MASNGPKSSKIATQSEEARALLEAEKKGRRGALVVSDMSPSEQEVVLRLRGVKSDIEVAKLEIEGEILVLDENPKTLVSSNTLPNRIKDNPESEKDSEQLQVKSSKTLHL